MNPRNKVSESQIKLIKQLNTHEIPPPLIALRLGISASTVYSILRQEPKDEVTHPR